jgi:LysR family nitrogen assimilation transcriptional regulator
VDATQSSPGLQVRPILRPAITTTVFFSASDHLPLSEPAKATRTVLMDVLRSLLRDAPQGIQSLLPMSAAHKESL